MSVFLVNSFHTLLMGRKKTLSKVSSNSVVYDEQGRRVAGITKTTMSGGKGGVSNFIGAKPGGQPRGHGRLVGGAGKPSVVHPRHEHDSLIEEKFALQMKIMDGHPTAMEDYMELHHDGAQIQPREW